MAAAFFRYPRTLFIRERYGLRYRPLCTSEAKKNRDGSTELKLFAKLKLQFLSMWTEALSLAKAFAKRGGVTAGGIKGGDSERLTQVSKMEKLKETMLLKRSTEKGTIYQILVSGVKANEDVTVKLENKVVFVATKSAAWLMDGLRYFAFFDVIETPGTLKKHSVSNEVLTLHFEE